MQQSKMHLNQSHLIDLNIASLGLHTVLFDFDSLISKRFHPLLSAIQWELAVEADFRPRDD